MTTATSSAKQSLQQMEQVIRGIFSIWKPPGITSQGVTKNLRWILQGGREHVDNIELVKRHSSDFSRDRRRKGGHWLKVGHGGTLDMAAEGVLVIGVGKACSHLEEYLVGTDKSYEVRCELGRMTDTLDSNGKIIAEAPWQHIKKEDLEEVLRTHFTGEIHQTPPVFSAKKIGGEMASDIVRRTGSMESVVLKPRKVTIKSIQLLTFDPPFYSISVTCTSGTYMRSLARDVAEQLGTAGHVRSLVRTRQGQFTCKTALREQDWTVENVLKVIGRLIESSMIHRPP